MRSSGTCSLLGGDAHRVLILQYRKYRVLDDCARLRDVINAFPPEDQRHYIPCLLVINWSEDEDTAKTMDLIDMVSIVMRSISSFSDTPP